MPSSLAIRMRNSLFAFRDRLYAAHVWRKRIGDGNRAILLLVIFHDRNERAADGDAGTVERMHVADIAALPGAITRIHAPRLEFAADRAGRNLAVHILAGQQ